MSINKDLENPLLDENSPEFEITKEALMDLFDADNRRTDLGGDMSISLEKLKKHGRADGLVRLLRTSVENGISSDPVELEARRRHFDTN